MLFLCFIPVNFKGAALARNESNMIMIQSQKERASLITCVIFVEFKSSFIPVQITSHHTHVQM